MLEKFAGNTVAAPQADTDEMRLPSRLGPFSSLKNKIGVLFLGASVGAVTFCEKAHAVVEPNGSSDATYVRLGTHGSNSCVFIPIANAYGGSFCSGVCLNSNWVLTAAHPFTDPSGNINGTAEGVMVGTPLTASSPLASVSESYIYPGFNNSENGPDLMLLKLASPLTNVPTLNIGNAKSGDCVTSYGYGMYGTPSSGMNEADGNLRSWQASVNTQVNVGYNSSYFNMSDFGFADTGLTNGMAGDGDSGGGVFNSTGQLVGITTAASSPSQPVGNTVYGNISNAQISNWILQTITPVQPTILSVNPQGADMQVTFQGKGGTNYVVQAASALGGTNTFKDISSVISLPGVGPVVTNYIDSGALTNYPARFYRVRED